MPRRTQSSARRLLAALPLLAACGAPPRPATPPFNVVLVSIDTLRPDHLGCYGYRKPTSPALDAFAEEAATFTQAIAQAPSTLPSHASILTSMLPHHHRASWEDERPLPAAAVSLAELLRDAGYATAAFTGGGQMDRVFGLDQGFDLYEQPPHARFAGTVRAAEPWLAAHAERRFFLFLHSYETHHPYEPEPRFLELLGHHYAGPLPEAITVELLRAINTGEVKLDAADLDHIVALYDAEVRSADEGFALLVQRLRDLGLWDDTLVIFTSDHGEEFGERSKVGWHSHTLYDEQLRVPLIIKFPRGAFAGARVERQVRSLDIAPTALAVLGLQPPRQFEGTDLQPLLRGEPVPRLVAISRRDRVDRDLTSVRTEEWKLLPDRLLNLAADPWEQWTVENPAVEAELERALRQALESGDALAPAPRVVPEDSTLAELKALGYLQ